MVEIFGSLVPIEEERQFNHIHLSCPRLDALLRGFQWLFENRERLPPQQSMDHKKPTKEGHGLVNMPLYGYAYAQKSKIGH